jgi:AcrR family transcriptional regulator
MQQTDPQADSSTVSAVSTVSTSPSRGDQTREALVAAAMDIFGRDGFHAASTRAIARAAGANQALIGYHFGGKQGLYLAVFESILAQVKADVLPLALGITAELDSLEAGATEVPERALACLEFREQQDPTEAFELLYRDMYDPLLGVLRRLVGLLLQVDPESETARARAMMILGQIIVFLAARTTALRQMHWEELGQAESEQLRIHLLESLRQQFTGVDQQ